MTKESHENGKRYIKFDDVIRLKHELNKRITNAGMNSREFLQFKQVTEEECQKIRLRYNQHHGKPYLKDAQFYLLILAGAAGVYFLPGWYKFLGVGLIAIIAFWFVWREGHRRGFFSGYATGYERGVEKSFSITPEMDAEMRARAVEMQVDEMDIAAMEKRSGQDADGR